MVLNYKEIFNTNNMLLHKNSCEKGQYLIFIFDIVCRYSSITSRTSCLKTKQEMGVRHSRWMI